MASKKQGAYAARLSSRRSPPLATHHFGVSVVWTGPRGESGVAFPDASRGLFGRCLHGAPHLTAVGLSSSACDPAGPEFAERRAAGWTIGGMEPRSAPAIVEEAPHGCTSSRTYDVSIRRQLRGAADIGRGLPGPGCRLRLNGRPDPAGGSRGGSQTSSSPVAITGRQPPARGLGCGVCRDPGGVSPRSAPRHSAQEALEDVEAPSSRIDRRDAPSPDNTSAAEEPQDVPWPQITIQDASQPAASDDAAPSEEWPRASQGDEPSDQLLLQPTAPLLQPAPSKSAAAVESAAPESAPAVDDRSEPATKINPDSLPPSNDTTPPAEASQDASASAETESISSPLPWGPSVPGPELDAILARADRLNRQAFDLAQRRRCIPRGMCSWTRFASWRRRRCATRDDGACQGSPLRVEGAG